MALPASSLHPAALPPDELLAQCEIRFLRRSGPGGQHRNKVSTAVVLAHRPTGVKAEANERRSQAENRTVALHRLRVQLALEVRHQPAAPPGPLWQSRLHGGRIEVSLAHRDFPALLAEALDVLAESRFDPKPAAARLRCSASQLIKFLKTEPRALTQVNEARRLQDLHALQ
jgi:hypothetical protein